MTATVEAVAAVADDGTIGDDGSIPWHHPEDLERFRELTTGHTVVMGRRTHESIMAGLGSPLPRRETVVLTRSPGDFEPREDPRVVAAGGVDAALDTALRLEPEGGTVFVAGGAMVYELMLPLCDRLHLTRVHETPAGDTRFPDWDPAEWRELSRAERGGLTFHEYGRLYRGVAGD